MGNTPHITPDRYPAQGVFLHRIVDVCFNRDASSAVRGKIIRDDTEEPGELIIQLDNGWVVRAHECQYSLVTVKKPT